MKRIRLSAALLAIAASTTVPATASAQVDQTYQFNLPAQDLGDALRAVAAKAGLQLFARTEDVTNIPAVQIHANLTPRQAIERLISGSDLQASFKDGVVTIRRTSNMTSSDDDSGKAILVTGSRINGAPPAAPVTIITSEDIKDAGLADLGEVARSLPMNFGGGQNPALSGTEGLANENVNINGSSSFNLRGIGPGATLTLLNGNRLSYSGVLSAVDASSIPIAALDRVEIIADGASAIYGSDAVAGVVNIILKSDYSGVAATARLGASTDGGDFEQQISGVAGARWRSGGAIATYDFFRNTAIKAGDRSYTSAGNPDTDIYPQITRQSFLLSGHQSLGQNVTFGADVIYKIVDMHTATGYLAERPITYQGNFSRASTETFAIAPSIQVNLSNGWTSKFSATYSTDNTLTTSYPFYSGQQDPTQLIPYKNRAKQLEVDTQGPLFSLPGGAARLAIGAGIRRVDFFVHLGNIYVSRHRNNAFAYVESFIPLVAPRNSVSFIRRASISGAVRVEDYSDSGRIATPKLGFIYQPFEALTLKASWGKSYKLPALYKQYSGSVTVLTSVKGYGNTFPADSTLIYLLGANEHDKAEHSENLTVSGELKPIHGLDISLSYFRIDYRDRVAQPLRTLTGVLTNPLYAPFVTLNPTTEQQNAAIASATQVAGLQNATAGPYDPAHVVGLVDLRDRNIAHQWYRGFDASVSYQWHIATGKKLMFFGNATWLHSRQVLFAGQPTSQLAGTIFYPPHFKSRGGVTADLKDISLSAIFSHVGYVIDNRRTEPVKIHSLNMLDLTGRFKLASNTEIGLNILNIFNAKPDRVFSSAAADALFDTTNYSPIGRFISLTISRAW